MKKYRAGDTLIVPTTYGGDEVTILHVSGFLCIHNVIDSTRSFVITHIPSGRQVCKTPSLKAAKKTMRLLNSCGANWDFRVQRTQEFTKKAPEKVCKYVRPVLQRLYQEGAIIS
jgi:hypothetical protein